MNNDICVVCGKPVPEGTMVCIACLREHNLDPPKEHYIEDENEIGGVICHRETTMTGSSTEPLIT